MTASPVHPAPGYAVPPGTDLPTFRGSLRRSYERFLATGEVDATIRPVVADSWRLSRDSGVSPDGVLPEVAWSAEELAAYREAHPLAAVMPVIRQLLLDDAAAHGAVVTVLDADSRLLWVEGDPVLRQRAESMHWVPSALWSEKLAGTNAPAASLRVGRPVQIFSREHYASNVEPWSCAAAPIRHPLTGEVLGALDITGRDDVAAPVVLGLVRATVAAAESHLRVLAMASSTPAVSDRPATTRARRPAGPAPGTLEVLGRTRGVVTDRGRVVPLSLRHSEILLLLSEDTAGYTADRLAIDLHERDVAVVTVRAELSRLRSLLPALELKGRPYQLGRPVRTDVGVVRDAIAAGDLAAAVSGYRGEVLPDSESPAVQRIRSDLRYELRSALLAGDDVDAVLRYARGPGRDDRSVWEHALHLAPAATRGSIQERLTAMDAELG